MRVSILGNSGSGKSTIAQWLSERTGAPLLDLDTVAWQPNQIAVPRSATAATSDVRAFCSQNEHWVIEGCYSGLISAALERGPLLLFINPGEAQCLANCRSRPWEQHKYSFKAEQDERLAYLLAWVTDYYSRQGDMSLSGHRQCFNTYTGPKVEVNTQPTLEPPAPEILAWLR